MFLGPWYRSFSRTEATFEECELSESVIWARGIMLLRKASKMAMSMALEKNEIGSVTSCLGCKMNERPPG